MKKIGDKVWTACAYISGIMIFLVSVMVLINVLLRRFTSYSILGCTELVKYFMCIAAALALMKNEWDDGNVRVTIILESLKNHRKTYAILDFVCYVIASIGFILITYFMIEQAIDTFVKGTLTTDLFMPMWIFSAILALGFVGLTICFWMRTIFKGYTMFHLDQEDKMK